MCKLEGQDRVGAIADLASEYAKEGEIEFDELTEEDISEGNDNGAYVRAWVWVEFDGTALDKNAESDEDCPHCADEPLPGDGPQHAKDKAE